MVSVTVGGKPWPSFTPAAETVDFSAVELEKVALRQTGLPRIVATFATPKHHLDSLYK